MILSGRSNSRLFPLSGGGAEPKMVRGMLGEPPLSKSPALVLCFILLCLLFTAAPSEARQPLVPTTITPNTLRAAAINEYVKGNTDSALDIYEQAVDLATRQYGGDSNYVGDLFYEMGSIALQGAKFQRAEAYLTQAVKTRPNSVTARARLVDLLLLRGRKEEAREHAKQAVVKHPDSIEARQAYAQALVESGDLSKAALAYAHVDLVRQGRKAPLPAVARPPKPPPPVPSETPATPPEAGKPEAKPKAAPKPEGKPKEPAKPKDKPKPKEKPKEKPGQAEKPKAKEKAKPAPKPEPPANAKPKDKPAEKLPEPKAKPQELKAKPAELLPPKPPDSKPKPQAKVKPGLVPPPPPVVPMMPSFPPPPPGPVGAGTPGFQLKTKAEVKPPPKPKETAKEEPSSHGGEDPDFLLDWSGVDRKKKH